MEGRILDIGGSSKLGYLELLKGKHTIDINNIDESYGCTVQFDLEKKWPVQNDAYEGVLAINIMEHIFDYHNVLLESFRVLKQKGKIVIAVPFLVPIHPCPHDYWRFTEETLLKILEGAGFSDIAVRPVGTGVWGAVANLKYNAFGRIPILWILVEKIAYFCDAVLQFFGKGKNFGSKNYPLGYIVIADKKLTKNL